MSQTNSSDDIYHNKYLLIICCLDKRKNVLLLGSQSEIIGSGSHTTTCDGRLWSQFVHNKKWSNHSMTVDFNSYLRQWIGRQVNKNLLSIDFNICNTFDDNTMNQIQGFGKHLQIPSDSYVFRFAIIIWIIFGTKSYLLFESCFSFALHNMKNIIRFRINIHLLM